MHRTASVTTSAANTQWKQAGEPVGTADVPAFLRSEEDAHATGLARALARASAGAATVGAAEGPDFLLDGADDMEC